MDNNTQNMNPDKKRAESFVMTISREELAERIATAALESADPYDLKKSFWETQFNWAMDQPDEFIMDAARDYEVIYEGEEVDLK